MKKELKDYLHLYLGCRVRTYSGFGNLTDIDLSGRWYVSLESGGGTVGNINDKNKPCPEESRKSFPNGYPPDSILTPILRPLSSMTEEEGYEIFGEEWSSDSPNAKDVVMNLDGEHELRLSPTETTALLSKSFDLFNLIPEGLAINAETLK